MQSKAKSVEEYLGSLPEDRKTALSRLRLTMKKNLPKGFVEIMTYGMLGYVVPHSIYPQGYHCDPTQPLPFISLASQKNYISLYHMGLYEGPLVSWFQKEWKKATSQKLDMGKCCVRFKKIDEIPLDLIGVLCRKMAPSEWIRIYEQAIRR